MPKPLRPLFEAEEGIDIYSAAAVNVAALQQAVADGRVRPDDVVMLNITGGGEKRFRQEHTLYSLQPSHVFPMDFTREDVARQLAALKF